MTRYSIAPPRVRTFKNMNYIDIEKANEKDKVNAMILIRHLSEDLNNEYI